MYPPHTKAAQQFYFEATFDACIESVKSMPQVKSPSGKRNELLKVD